MPGKFWQVFLMATLLLSLWRGDGHTTGTTRGEVLAATSTLTTKKINDVQLGEVIQIGSTKFVKIAANRYQALEPYTCADPVLTYAGAVKNFDYTGGQQTYTAYAGCQYKLEVWGAQGGSGTRTGGYGSYSTGTIAMNISSPLYVYVGGAGTYSGSANTAGGYNGGGGSLYSNVSGERASGGGASHIALVSGLLPNLSAHSSDNTIVTVAAGGGGAAYYASDQYGDGGHGGGIKGNDGTQGGTQTCVIGRGGTQSAGGAGAANGTFGKGADAIKTYSDSSWGGAGGGGGYYGGGSAFNNVGGGGGSGYIASSNLISAAGVTKHMTCYNCATSTADATRTQSNTCVSGAATADCSKTGNGFARITRLN